MSLKSLREHEGYFMLDHSQTEGISDELIIAAGLPRGAGKGLFEAPCYTCKHCQRIVVMNPDRTRERAYCRGCDHLICDECAAVKAKTLTCRTFDQIADEILTEAAKAASK